uniref:Fungal lipase-like domain-containing protein n=1 Tax=Salix viminalis TaxID=40686 RepID=A0A6N2KSW6_SALVM
MKLPTSCPDHHTAAFHLHLKASPRKHGKPVPKTPLPRRIVAKEARHMQEVPESLNSFEDVKGVESSSKWMVHDLIYHIELAERPGYYIAIDPQKKLVILGIHGTYTVYDLITDIVASSDEEVTSEGYSTHFGTAEAACWLISHETLRLAGHSLGAAAASLLAIMLCKMSIKELGFVPDIVTADDIIHRLGAASLARLRMKFFKLIGEYAYADNLKYKKLMSLAEKDWKSVMGSDAAQKLADYARFGSKKSSSSNTILLSPDSRRTGYLNEWGHRAWRWLSNLSNGEAELQYLELNNLRKEGLEAAWCCEVDTCGRSKGGFLEKKSQQFPNEAECFEEKCKGRDLIVISGSVYYLKTDITTATETSSGRDMDFPRRGGVVQTNSRRIHSDTATTNKLFLSRASQIKSSATDSHYRRLIGNDRKFR